MKRKLLSTELEFNCVFDLSESKLTVNQLKAELIKFIESKNVYYVGTFTDSSDDMEDNEEIIGFNKIENM